ncbi:hypothetical protein GQX73_g6783 [Xylaria multiplex]|uniref:Uncharacterized protein n=1 Tax=Xylaria multiplex TaxID=323545 RepID=A0A7C8IS73_9PEZI|nr:hypothetical protein GQX73_g6783 [Xylaria multiplex]
MEPVPINEDNGIVEDPFLPDEMMVEEGSGATETEQVAVNRTDANPANPPSEQPVPISAILFNGPPGPKDCRGSAILNIGLTKPGARHSSPTCYNVPGVAQCGNFLANKDDGCQARIFNEPDCRTFANLAVFIPEMRAFGGYIRSIEVTCGVISETPPPLNLPGLELPPNALQAAG